MSALDIYETLCNAHFVNETNFDWDDLRLFLAIARKGGLAAASEATGKSAATSGRRMLDLERNLALDLFVRHPRGYALTTDGQDLLRQVQAWESQMAPILDRSQKPATPIVKISAGTWVSQLLCQNVAKLIVDTPVRLRFVTTEEAVDIGHRAAVIGIRNRRPVERGLAGRRVGTIRFGAFATHTSPLPWAQVQGTTPSAAWVRDQDHSMPPIEVTSPRNALDLALGGQAKVALPVFIAKCHPALLPLCAPITELDHDQWLVTHHEDRFLPQVRQVIDRTYDVLRQNCTH